MTQLSAQTSFRARTRSESRVWWAATALALSLPLLAAGAQGRLAPAPKPAGVTAQMGWGKMPLYFVPNRGQMGRHADFYVPGQREQVYFDSRGITFALEGSGRQSAVSGQQSAVSGQRSIRRRSDPSYGSDPSGVHALTRSQPNTSTHSITRSPVYPLILPHHHTPASFLSLAFRGARTVQPVAAADLGTRFNYFSGPKSKWKTGIPAFGELTYRNLWPGIDLAFRGTTDRLKYEFRVRPGADPAQIRLVYRGAQHVRVDDGGRLIAETPTGDVTDAAPVTFQTAPAGKSPVESRWQARETGDVTEVSFRLGAYDRRRSLVIDPETIVYCGYLSGSQQTNGEGIAVDAAGAAYVTGYTGNGTFSGFMAKVNPAGNAVEYFDYIEGNQGTEATGIAVDAAGAAYVTGYTASGPAQVFPVTAGAFSTSYNGGDATNGFVAKVNPAGTALVYCGYLEGSQGTAGNGVAVDAAGAAYVTGYTLSSPAQGFPVTPGAFSTTYNGGDLFSNIFNSFVAKGNPAGTALEYCGYLEGSGGIGTRANGIAVDTAGAVYVTGLTESTPAQGFPATAGAFGTTYSGGGDGFVAKISGVLAVNDAYSANQNQTLNVSAASGLLANDLDADGVALTAALVAGPSHGSLTFNADGSFSYTPATGYVGADSFTYTASEGALHSSPATVTITVFGITSGPVLTSLTLFKAVITWTTNLGSVSNTASYGPAATGAYGSTQTDPANNTTTHVATLTGLTPGTQYHYRVSSTATGVGTVQSPEIFFATPASSSGQAASFQLFRNEEGTITLDVTILDGGGTAVTHAEVQHASIGTTLPSTSVPALAGSGTITAQSSAIASLTFPSSVGASGTRVVLQFAWSTSAGGGLQNVTLALP